MWAISHNGRVVAVEITHNNESWPTQWSQGSRVWNRFHPSTTWSGHVVQLPVITNWAHFDRDRLTDKDVFRILYVSIISHWLERQKGGKYFHLIRCEQLFKLNLSATLLQYTMRSPPRLLGDSARDRLHSREQEIIVVIRVVETATLKQSITCCDKLSI